MMSLTACHGRLTRDAAELFATDFTCSASHVQVLQTTDSLNDAGSIVLEISVFEGPYRGGVFHFCFQIPANYPFRPLEIWAVHPIWHPNIDLKSGRMQIPLEWSPVLTLKSFARSVQMLMIQPSVEGPMNMEAYSLFLNDSVQFDFHAQLTLRGGWFSEVYFPCALIPTVQPPTAGFSQKLSGTMDMSPVVSAKVSTMQSPVTMTNNKTNAQNECNSTFPNNYPASMVLQEHYNEMNISGGVKMKRPYGAISEDLTAENSDCEPQNNHRHQSYRFEQIDSDDMDDGVDDDIDLDSDIDRASTPSLSTTVASNTTGNVYTLPNVQTGSFSLYNGNQSTQQTLSRLSLQSPVEYLSTANNHYQNNSSSDHESVDTNVPANVYLSRAFSSQHKGLGQSPRKKIRKT